MLNAWLGELDSLQKVRKKKGEEKKLPTFYRLLSPLPSLLASSSAPLSSTSQRNSSLKIIA